MLTNVYREYQTHPYNLAEITLTPAEHLSEAGKTRNMHMQTHKDLTDVQPIHVFGMGQRKGQLALFQFVKDAYDFRRDLLLDEQEEAVRTGRPFVTPRNLNATEQLTNLPADPNRHLRDLFESQSQRASTPSEVGYHAHQAAMQYIHGNPQADMVSTRLRMNFFPAIREGDVFESPISAESQTFQPSTLVSRFQPQINETQLVNEANSSHNFTPQQPTMNKIASVEEILDAGMVAARKIYQTPAMHSNGEQPIPQLPNVKEFLDVERCRTILQQVDTQAYDMFAAWQNNQRCTYQPSWAACTKSNLSRQIANEDTEMDDSGIGMTQDSAKENGELSQQPDANNDAAEKSNPNEVKAAVQAISAERHSLPVRNAPSHLFDHQKSKERQDAYEDAPTPTMSAASTLLSLSPAKVIEAGQSHAN